MSPKKYSTDQLTTREEDIIKLIVHGYSNKQVGTVLNISATTVSTHRRSIYRKLNVSSIAELVRFAIKSKLVS